MDYVTTINTEHSTYTRSAPKRTVIQMTRGRLTRGWIYFPSGPAGLLHATVLRASLQIAPVDREQSYCLDDVIATLSPEYDLDQPPFRIIIATWNDSTTYDHTLTISLTLDPFFGKPPKRAFLSSFFQKPIFNNNHVQPDPTDPPGGPPTTLSRYSYGRKAGLY